MMRGIFVVGMMVGLIGCGGAASRYEISGNVTYKGKPVPAGQILFSPNADKGNAGPGGAADIKDGQYKTGKDQGVIGGPHIVSIFGYDGKPIPIPGDPGKNVNPNGTPLFTEYKIEVDLPKSSTTKDFDVPK